VRTKHERWILAILILDAALIVGCSTAEAPSLVESRDNRIVQGNGGVVRRVDDIDFWESGQPNRPYQILGIIYDYDGWTWTSVDSLRPKEARWVIGEGGDGAIVGKEREKATKTRNGTIFVIVGSPDLRLSNTRTKFSRNLEFAMQPCAEHGHRPAVAVKRRFGDELIIQSRVDVFADFEVVVGFQNFLPAIIQTAIAR
jgi:hypothetical protein